MSNVKRLLFILLFSVSVFVVLFSIRRQDFQPAVHLDVPQAESGAGPAEPVLLSEPPGKPIASPVEFEEMERELPVLPPLPSVAEPEHANSLSGRVVDETGSPVANVAVFGLPQGGDGVGSTGRTERDGSFDIPLRNLVPHRFMLMHSGYEILDDLQFYEPGTQDIELVIITTPEVTFLVRDEITGLPVERFGLRTFKARLGDYGRIGVAGREEVPECEDHPDGSVLCLGHPDSHDFVIAAPGFAPQSGRVEFDSPGSSTQTIRLGRSGAIAGRLVLDGNGVSAAEIECAANRKHERYDSNLRKLFKKGWGREAEDFAGYRRLYLAEQDGSFRIEDLAPGDYQLEIKGEGVAPLQIARVRVIAGRTTDLGRLEGYAPGEILGALLLPKGMDSEGIEVALGTERNRQRQDEKKSVSDAEGQFRFEGLSEGTYYLWVRAKARVIVDASPTQVDLQPSEQRSLQIDLSDRVPCSIEIQLSLDGPTAKSTQVFVKFADSPRTSHWVGTTNEAGFLRRGVLGRAGAVFKVLTPEFLPLGKSDPVDLHPGGFRRLDLNFETGRLLLERPLGLENEASIPIVLQRATFEWPADSKWAASPTGAWQADMGEVAIGEYTLQLRHSSGVQERRIELRRGETTVVTFD